MSVSRKMRSSLVRTLAAVLPLGMCLLFGCGDKETAADAPNKVVAKHEIVAGYDYEARAVVYWLDGRQSAPNDATSHLRAAANGAEEVRVILIEEPVSHSRIWVPVPFTGGCIWFDLRLDNGGVRAPCFNGGRNHFNIQLRDRCKNKNLCNIHVTGWWKSGPQIGLWNSTNNWCLTTQGSLGKLRDAIRDVLLAAGATGVVALATAEITAPIIFPALAF